MVLDLAANTIALHTSKITSTKANHVLADRQ